MQQGQILALPVSSEKAPIAVFRKMRYVVGLGPSYLLWLYNLSILPHLFEKGYSLFSSCVTELILSSLGHQFYVERSGGNYFIVSHVEGVFNSSYVNDSKYFSSHFISCQNFAIAFVNLPSVSRRAAENCRAMSCL
jgi:hypothetical protein